MSSYSSIGLSQSQSPISNSQIKQLSRSHYQESKNLPCSQTVRRLQHDPPASLHTMKPKMDPSLQLNHYLNQQNNTLNHNNPSRAGLNSSFLSNQSIYSQTRSSPLPKSRAITPSKSPTRNRTTIQQQPYQLNTPITESKSGHSQSQANLHDNLPEVDSHYESSRVNPDQFESVKRATRAQSAYISNQPKSQQQQQPQQQQAISQTQPVASTPSKGGFFSCYGGGSKNEIENNMLPKKEIPEIDNRIEQYEAEIYQLKVEKQQMQEGYENLVHQKEDNIAQLHSALQLKQDEIQDRNSSQNKSAIQIDGQQKEIALLRRNAESQKDQINVLQRINDTLKNNTEAEQKLNELQQHTLLLASQLEQVSGMLQQKTAECDALNAQMESKRKELLSSQNDCGVFAERANSQAVRIKKLEAEQVELQSKMKMYSEELDKLQTIVQAQTTDTMHVTDGLVKENAMLRGQLANAAKIEADVSAMSNQNMQLSGVVKDYERRFKEISEAADQRILKNAREKEQILKESDAKVREMRDKIARLEAELERNSYENHEKVKDLSSRVREAEASMSQRSAAISQREHAVSEMATKLSEAEVGHAQAIGEVTSQYQAICRDNAKEVQSLQAQLFETRVQNQKLVEDNTKLAFELDLIVKNQQREISRQLEQLERQLREQFEEDITQINEVNAKERDLLHEQHVKETEQRNMQNARERDQLAAQFAREREQLNGQVREQQGRLQELQARLNEAKERIEELMQDQSANEKVKRSMKDKEDESVRANRTALESARQLLENTNASLESAKNALEQRVRILEKENEGLRASQKVLEKNIKDAQNDIEMLQRQVNEKQAQIDQLKRQVDDLKGRLAQSESMKQSSEDIESVKRERDLNAQQVKQLAGAISQLEIEKARLSQEVAFKQSELQRQAEKFKSIEGALNGQIAEISAALEEEQRARELGEGADYDYSELIAQHNMEKLSWETAMLKLKSELKEAEQHIAQLTQENKILMAQGVERLTMIENWKKSTSPLMRSNSLETSKHIQSLEEELLRERHERTSLENQLQKYENDFKNKEAEVNELYGLLNKRQEDQNQQKKSNADVKQQNEQLKERLKQIEAEALVKTEYYDRWLLENEELQRQVKHYKQQQKIAEDNLQVKSKEIDESLSDVRQLKSRYEEAISESKSANQFSPISFLKKDNSSSFVSLHDNNGLNSRGPSPVRIKPSQKASVFDQSGNFVLQNNKFTNQQENMNSFNSQIGGVSGSSSNYGGSGVYVPTNTVQYVPQQQQQQQQQKLLNTSTFGSLLPAAQTPVYQSSFSESKLSNNPRPATIIASTNGTKPQNQLYMNDLNTFNSMSGYNNPYTTPIANENLSYSAIPSSYNAASIIPPSQSSYMRGINGNANANEYAQNPLQSGREDGSSSLGSDRHQVNNMTYTDQLSQLSPISDFSMRQEPSPFAQKTNGERYRPVISAVSENSEASFKPNSSSSKQWQ